MDNASKPDQRTPIRPGVVILIVAIFGVLLAGRFLGWFGGKRTENPPEQALVATPEAGGASRPAPAPTPGTAQTPTEVSPGAGLPPTPAPSTARRPGELRPSFPPVPVNPLTSAPATPAAPMSEADWSAAIDNVLGGNDDETKKADQLLEMLPRLPEDGQVEAIQHISNLLPDEKFSSLNTMLTNAVTAEPVLEILMTDTLNRPNALKLPTLLQIARQPGHPKSEEARDILEVFVDENYGEDWSKWEKAVQDWLKENPDEP